MSMALSKKVYIASSIIIVCCFYGTLPKHFEGQAASLPEFTGETHVVILLTLQHTEASYSVRPTSQYFWKKIVQYLL